jgi:hypothetical protein
MPETFSLLISLFSSHSKSFFLSSDPQRVLHYLPPSQPDPRP